MARVDTATFPAMGFDANVVIAADAAAGLRAAGFSFAVRYLSIGAQGGHDLSAAELAMLLGANFAVMPVQHVRYPGWAPSAAMGESDGKQAGANAGVCGIPAGATVWCASEGQVGSAEDSIAYLDAWATAVAAAGYDPGLYVGAGTPLTPDQLYALKVDRYWKSFSRVSEPSNCGFCMLQLYKETVVAGVTIDVDVLQYDYKGRLPSWVIGD